MRVGSLSLGRDGWAGFVVLIFSSILFLLTIGLPEMPLVPVGPGFYPRIVLGFTALMGLWLVLADYRRKRLTNPLEKVPAPGLHGLVRRFRDVVIHFSMFAVYIAAMSPLGFRISTLVYVAASSYLLDPPRSPKAWVRVAVLAVLAAFLTFFVFERYLAVLLPRGRWTSF